MNSMGLCAGRQTPSFSVIFVHSLYRGRNTTLLFVMGLLPDQITESFEMSQLLLPLESPLPKAASSAFNFLFAPDKSNNCSFIQFLRQAIQTAFLGI